MLVVKSNWGWSKKKDESTFIALVEDSMLFGIRSGPLKTIHPGHLQQMAELCIRVNKFESNKLDGELYYMDFYTRGEKEFERRIVDFQYQLELNGIVASFLHDRKMPAM